MRKINTVLRWLTQPEASLPEPERRRARLLAWLLLALILLLSATFLLVQFSNPVDTPRHGEYTFLIGGLLVLLVLAYYLNRTGHYASSAGLTVACAVLGPWGSIALDRTILQGNFVPLVFVSLSVLLCSILLPALVTSLLAAIQFVALLLLPVFEPAIAAMDWTSLMAFMLFTAVLSILANLISRLDIDQIDRQARQLAEISDQLQSILDNTTTIIYLKDVQGRYLLVNRPYETTFHVYRAQIVGKTAADIFPKELAQTYWANDQKVLQTGLHLEEEETAPLQDGVHTYITVKFPLHNSSGEIYAVCSLSTDITARKQVEEALRNQSVRDPLTNLFNRRYMEETLERELRRAARNQRSLGIMMSDIDQFKLFNDTYGHAAGDALLRELGTFLHRHLRAADIACRYGGEEFTLILPEACLEVMRERAEHLREEVKNLHIQYEGKTLEAIRLSSGVAVFPDHGTTSEAIMKAADTALYRAKREGRDRVVVAE